MKNVLIILTVLFASLTSWRPKSYHYEVGWRNYNIGYYYITYADSSEKVSDSITIQVLGDHEPSNRAKVIWVSNGDTIISQTDIHGEISIRRDTYDVILPTGDIILTPPPAAVEIFPNGDMYKPIKQYVQFWESGISGKGRIPTRITFELETWNPWTIRIESDHPLGSSDIENIRDSVLHNWGNPQKFKGIRYEVVWEF